VDALVGRQTRAHRDLDIDIDARDAAEVLTVLHDLGYVIETDWRPNRVQLMAAGRGRVDVHPLSFDNAGNGLQAGLDGETYVYPRASFTTGSIGGRTVRCLSAEQQIEWHAGYPLRDCDNADLDQLHRLTAG
jgi:lincosamide nucleotidyltransferase A/C/D/E